MSRTTAPLQDRELVKLLADEPELLAIADALVETRRTGRRDMSGGHRRRFAMAAIAAVCVAAVASVVFTGALGGPGKRHTSHGPHGSGGTDLVTPLPTLQHPLPYGSTQTTLSDAATMLGVPLLLPDTTFVQPSDAGPVWVDGTGPPSPTAVAVTFPAQDVIIEYIRPAPSDGSAAHFQSMTQSMPSRNGGSEGHVITLNGGVAALAVQQNSDDTGHNFGEIIFNMAGSEIRVMGHYEEATLETLARSILSQSLSG